MSRYRYALLLLPPFVLAGCLKQDNPQGQEAAASAAQPTIHYRVAEATVQLEHDYQGRIEPDVTETVTLRFRHGYTSGLMRVEFYAHDGLEIYNAEAPRVLPLNAAQPLILPIELTAPAAGEYYLSIFTTVESADGEVSKRIFGLDLKAGDDGEVARKAPKIDRVQDTASGEGIVVMPAQETIASP